MNMKYQIISLCFNVFLLLCGLSAAAVNAGSLMVTNSGDSGAGSLRQTIADAAAEDVIGFGNDVTTVTLTSNPLEINKSLTIEGGENGVTITRSGNFCVFNISGNEVRVRLNKLNILVGTAPNLGCGVSGNLDGVNITNSVISGIPEVKPTPKVEVKETTTTTTVTTVTVKEVKEVKEEPVKPNQPLPIDADVLAEINLVRRDPAGYIKFLEEWKKFYKGNEFSMPGEQTIVTNEGTAVVDEAIEFLRSLKPMEAVAMNNGLISAANTHLKDMQTNNLRGHQGSDGSLPDARVERFGTLEGSVGELIDYGGKNAREIVIKIILDDGVGNRGHRLKLLSPNFRQIGLAIGDSKEHQSLCVVVMARDFTEKK
jgi:uncharacterized protein YkwD